MTKSLAAAITRDLSLAFESTVELYTLSPIPAAGSMPPGWRIRMPMGDQHVSAEMFTLEPERHGAYRLTTSKRRPVDDWEETALCLLGDIVAVFVTGSLAITDEVAERIACEFHIACALGTRPAWCVSLDASRTKVIDGAAMQWVTVRQRA